MNRKIIAKHSTTVESSQDACSEFTQLSLVENAKNIRIKWG
ncbi:MAG: hypothetical protein WBA93_21245 [Microcoleaceae cyanobacterium]